MMYEFEGMVKFGKGWQPFRKVVEGKSEGHAVHKLYSLFGSLNGLKRSAVKIEKIVEVKEDAKHG